MVERVVARGKICKYHQLEHTEDEDYFTSIIGYVPFKQMSDLWLLSWFIVIMFSYICSCNNGSFRDRVRTELMSFSCYRLKMIGKLVLKLVKVCITAANKITKRG